MSATSIDSTLGLPAKSRHAGEGTLPWMTSAGSGALRGAALRAGPRGAPLTIRSATEVIDILDSRAPAIEAPARPRRSWRPSANIHRLDPYGSRIAARSVARHHALEIEAEHDEALDGSARLMAAMCRPLLGGRKASMAQFEDAARLLAGNFKTRSRDVGTVVYREEGRRRSDPCLTGVAVRVDTGYLSDAGDIGMHGIVHARCTAARLTRDAVAMAWHPLACSWSQHAAERALERGAVVGNVHLSLGRDLARLAPVIAVMSDALRRRHVDASLPIPFAGGLLFGAIDIEPAGVATSAMMKGVNVHREDTNFFAHDAHQAWATMLGLDAPTTWTAWTFYGEATLTLRQVAWRDWFESASQGIDDGMTGELCRRAMATLLETYDKDCVGSRLGAFDGTDAASGGGVNHGETGATRAMLDAFRDKALEAYGEGVIETRKRDREGMRGEPIHLREHDDDPATRGLTMAIRRKA